MTLGGVHFRWTPRGLTIKNSGRDDVRAATRRDVNVMDDIGLRDALAGVNRRQIHEI